MKNSFKLAFHISALSFLFLNETKGQITVDKNHTPEELVQDFLLGPGVQVSNITFNGDPLNQLGLVNGSNSLLGITDGILLTTGDANIAIGPNDNPGAGSSSNNSVSDPDLASIAGININDAAILEFDFIPSGDSLKFKYVFASEEYNNFVCSSFNDAFGFFISGPGFNGPYSNNAENIALIPNTTTPVAINTINNGNMGSAGTLGGCGGPGNPGLQNSIYFFDNELGIDNAVQYDGYTVVLTAFAVVQCDSSYHIKIAIGDASDDAFDSGVLLEAKSFGSEGVNISAISSIGDSIITETCDASAIFTFSRSETTENLTIHFDIEGTAIPGVDYNTIPDSIVLPVGEREASIEVFPFDDAINESTEDIRLAISYTNSCGNLRIVDASIYIVNVNPIEVTIACNGDGIQEGGYLKADATGGITPYQYHWISPYGNQSTIFIDRGKSSDIEIMVNDSCGNSGTAKIDQIDPLCTPWAPNVFSPNNDGQNDVFYLQFLEQYPPSDILIYNRWGKIVYQNQQYLNNWDGKHYKTGTKVHSGVYYYTINIPSLPDPYTGYISILY